MNAIEQVLGNKKGLSPRCILLNGHAIFQIHLYCTTAIILPQAELSF